MELLIVGVSWIAVAIAAALRGVDTRPGLDDEPHRSI